MRRLTRLEYTNAVSDLLGVGKELTTGLIEDESHGGFAANTTAEVQVLHVERYADVAQTIASSVDLQASTLGCSPQSQDCLTRFSQQLAQRAFRRPLTEQERTSLAELERLEGDFQTKARTIVEAILQSPSFLYRPELGLDEGDATLPLGDYELASRLSFLLWASIPDEPLLTAAETGAIRTKEGLLQEAQRMMASPKFNDSIDSFHRQWLNLDKLAITPKDQVYNNWNEIREAALLEPLLYTRALAEEGKRFGEYFYPTQPHTYADTALAQVYGVTAPEQAFARVELDGTQRAGILTQVAFLALNAKPRTTSPVHRGEFVRKDVLCGELFPPPANVDTSLPEPPAGTTMREQLQAHRADPACKGCHELMDPIGLVFEHYDALGAYREMEAGRPVDASGYIASTVSTDASFNNALELSKHLAESQEVATCIAKKWFTFTFARPPANEEQCALDNSIQGGSGVRQTLLDFIASDTFRRIQKPR